MGDVKRSIEPAQQSRTVNAERRGARRGNDDISNGQGKFRTRILLFGVALLLVGIYPAWRQISLSRDLARAKTDLAAAEFETAITTLKSLAARHPARADVPYLLAVAYRRSGQLDKVGDQLALAAGKGWSQEDIHRQQLLIRAQVGRFHEVEPELKRIFERGTHDEAALEIYEALAHGYWANHDIHETLRCLDFWIQWRPHDVDPRLMRADVYTEFNDPVSAEKDYRALLDFAPDNVQARILYARLLLQRGEVAAAEKEYDESLRREPGNALAILGKSECAFRSGRADEADTWAAKLEYQRETPERQAKILKLKADIARFRQQHSEAVALLEQAVKVWPHDSAVHQSLGAAYAAVGNRELANRHLELTRVITDRAQRFYDLEREIIANPKNPDLRFEVGVILEEQGLLGDASGWWHSAVRCDGQHQLSLEALARYYRERGESELADRFRNTAQQCLPKSFHRAWRALRNGDLKNAARWEEALAAYPEGRPFVELLQIARKCKDGKFAEVVQILDDAGPRLDQNSFAAVLRGEAYLGMGRVPEAERALQESLKLSPDATDVHRLLAVIYYDLGAGDHAAYHLTRVSQLDPSDYRPDRLLGLMNKDYEVFDEAVQHYRESLRRDPVQKPREEVLLEMAYCLIRLRDYSEALRVLADAKPSVDRSVLMAECFYNTRETEQAVKLLDEALVDAPDHLGGILLRADAAANASDNDVAKKLLTRAVQVYPFDFEAHHRLAQVLTRRGETEEGMRHSQRAHKLKKLRENFAKLHQEAFERPYDIALRRELARVAQEMGRPELCEIWKKAADSLEQPSTSRPASSSGEKAKPTGGDDAGGDR